MPKIRNIIIFSIIAVALISIYILFIKPSPNQEALVSSSSSPAAASTTTAPGATPVTQDFLTLLLSVKNIKLDDSIFSDPAFSSLHDSSIILVPDGTEGRPNPFAQFSATTPLPNPTPLTPPRKSTP